MRKIIIIVMCCAAIVSAQHRQRTPTESNATENDCTEIVTMPEVEPEQWNMLENVRIYHYCPCKKCCGKDVTDPAYNITKSGTVAKAESTIAVDTSVIPLGSEVIIEGQTYIAEDTGGGIKGKTIDIYCDSHQEALEKGTYKTTILWKAGE